MATIQELMRRFPLSPLSLIGFSMGGNITLKLLGERTTPPGVLAAISRAVAVCPPIDLSFTVDSLRFGLARWYDAYFTKACIRDVRTRQRLRPDAIIPDGWFDHPPTTMRQFDESFTAPVCGFASSEDYYRRSSAKQFLTSIEVPTLIIATQDDPVVPFTPYHEASLSSAIHLSVQKYGGHMGFVATRGVGWLDRQILDWTLAVDEEADSTAQQ